MKNLTQTLFSCSTESQIHEFLIDLLTPAERQEFEQRRQIAQQLNQWASYKQIEQEYNTSSTTIARVAKCLHRNNSGYKSIMITHL
jgi:TrpR-related protein YerC/YecD